MIYLASPYTHPNPRVMDERFEEVARLTAAMLNVGHMIYSPIVHCHPIAVRHTLPRDFEFWKNYNLHMLSLAEALWVFELDGWKESTGVGMEILFAQLNDIPINYITIEGKPRG